MKTLNVGTGNSRVSSYRVLFIALFAVVVAFRYVAAQEAIDVVYLKNGDVLKGTIIEQIPFESIKMQLPGGSTITVKYSDIAKIAKEKSAAPQAPAVSNPPAVTIETQRTQMYEPIRTTPVISLGYGNSFGGLGANLSAYVSPTLALHIGGGWFPLSKIKEGAADMFLAAGGARVFFSGPEKTSRGYMDIQFGMLGGEYRETSLSYGGVIISTTKKQQALYGPSVLFGTEAFWGDGTIGGRIAGGGSYNLAKVDWTEVKFLWALDVGLMFRF
jgi:hypothetical protein